MKKLLALIVTVSVITVYSVFPREVQAATVAPTLSDYQQSTWTDVTSGNEVTPTVTWSAGDVIVVVGSTESFLTAVLLTPTASGLTFSLVTETSTDSNTNNYVWSATAGSSGSGAITSVADGSSSCPGGFRVCQRGIAAFVYRGSDGVGNTNSIVDSATTNTVISLVRSGDSSAVVVVMGDWNTVDDTSATANPVSGGTVADLNGGAAGNLARVAGSATQYVASWTDQGAAGTTSYGIGSYTATPKWAGIVVEVLGVAAPTGVGKKVIIMGVRVIIMGSRVLFP